MDQVIWQKVDPQLQEITEELERLLSSAQAQKLHTMLTKLSQTVEKQYSTHLSCSLNVFHLDRQKSLSLFNIGLGVSDAGEVYPTTGESNSFRYLVDGQIEVVPHGRCPKCLGEWGLQWTFPQCSHCDAELGINCWLLVDSDSCPNCEEGKISANNTHCLNCGFFIDPKFVRWD